MLSNDILKHQREIAKAIRAHKYDYTDTGIYIPSMHANVGGVMESWHNHRAHQVHKNLVTTEGRNKALQVLVANTGLVSAWRVALGATDYTPVAGLTAASFVTDTGEFTDYDEPARPEFVDGTIASGSVSNSASKAEFTISTGVEDEDLFTASLHSNSAKSSTTGTVLACSRFSSTRTVNATDVLTIQYTLSLTSS